MFQELKEYIWFNKLDYIYFLYWKWLFEWHIANTLPNTKEYYINLLKQSFEQDILICQENIEISKHNNNERKKLYQYFEHNKITILNIQKNLIFIDSNKTIYKLNDIHWYYQRCHDNINIYFN